MINCPGYDELVARLDRSVEAGDTGAITQAVKADLEYILGHRLLALPSALVAARPDRASVTLHVYGGDLDDCKVFLPATHDGRYGETTKALSFHE